MKKMLAPLAIAVVLAGRLALAADPQPPVPDKRPSKTWERTGPLGQTPQHVSDAFPLSDQENKGGWVKFEPMSDEFERKYNMNLHVFQTPREKKHWDVQHTWVAPWRLADDYHVYGLEWGADEIKYYVDGAVVRTVENTHWHQPLYLTFDSETMPDWFGMPADQDLPSTFSVDYVRAWQKQAAGSR
jgi:hypothetical protein